ncbi:MAG: TRAP transporter permease [Desulfovibrio sp.]|jgi:TRAP transporter 4TM/12TM fusion protein|nr:TRAP transporter permease [Desulfovibrio sp.]
MIATNDPPRMPDNKHVEAGPAAGTENDPQGQVDVNAILAKYDKESIHREFRKPTATIIAVICVLFSLFHLYTAAFGAFPPQIQRSVHLAFALFLIFILYPATERGSRSFLPWTDILLASAGAWVCIYIIINYEAIVLDVDPPGPVDYAHALAAVLLLLEATRRVVGLPIAVVATVFLAYALFGEHLPGMVGHGGFSLRRILSHMYLTTEGIFGVPLGVSASFVFLFILFGSFLHSTGLGKFFIDLALAATGHRVGGPAKVAIVASGFFGTISGSSVANTVSTGAFTIPLMRSIGYRGAFAGAVEAAASTGGQIMPPVMGAAAFIMAQFLGMPYVDIAKAALIPAVLYYLSVGIMVHMEALRMNLQAIPASRLPRVGKVLREGGHLLIPIAVLVWLLSTGFTPYMAAFACILTTVAVTGTVSFAVRIIGAKRNNELVSKALHLAAAELGTTVWKSMESGARAGLAVAAACACTGLVIGVVTLTGIGLKLANGIVTLSGGIFFLTLLLTMAASIILGMGLPTTAKYIILATIATPAIQSFGVPALAAHLFIMYFGILADVTPPVALCAYAAAGIAKAGPNETGFTALKLAGAGFIIPYIFCYNPGLILINTTWPEVVFYVATAVMGIFSLAVAVVGYWRTHIPSAQRILLLAGACGLITPGLLSDLCGLAILAFVYLMQTLRLKKSRGKNRRSGCLNPTGDKAENGL